MKVELELDSLSELLLKDSILCPEKLHIKMGEYTLAVKSNSISLLEKLESYFSHILVETDNFDDEIIAIDSSPLELNLPFIDWSREKGKTGRKDAYYDIEGGRLIQKIRTGMIFLQSEKYRMAAGSCLQYESQLINFINSQYMNWLQQRNWLICHASALVLNGQCLAIAGFSGGGKSTLMLHLMERDEAVFVTNDRLFIKSDNGHVQCNGIPKLPRINPGTIVHNQRLHGLIAEDERERLLRIPKSELWQVEDKYDVDINKIYGPGKIQHSAQLRAFLILNWSLSETEMLRVEKIDLNKRLDLLTAIMKSPGPFYQGSDGRFQQDSAQFDEAAYLGILSKVPVYEVSGKIDFNAMINNHIEQILIG